MTERRGRRADVFDILHQQELDCMAWEQELSRRLQAEGMQSFTKMQLVGVITYMKINTVATWLRTILEALEDIHTAQK